MEDCLEVRDLFAMFLPTLGHWVESAGDAGTALERLCQGGFDVLITDLWQPNAYGWCLLDELRARGDLPAHVISTSAGIQPDTVQLSQAAGCRAHFAQPFWLSEIEQALETVRLVESIPPVLREHTHADVQNLLLYSALRTEALRLRTESHLLRAIVARNIASCSHAVDEARKNLAQWQNKALS